MDRPTLEEIRSEAFLRQAHSVLLKIEQLEQGVPAVKLGVALKPELRGVHHRIGVDGSLTFEIIDSDGIVQFEVKPASVHCNQRTFRWCERVLDAIDPPRGRLRAI